MGVLSAVILRHVRWSLLLLCLAAASAVADTTVRVVSVVDGGTVAVLDADNKRFKVLLAGVAAPRFGQPFHKQSTTSLSALAFNREAELKGMRVDGNGNHVATLMVAASGCHTPACPKLRDAGLAQVESGMAWWYPQYQWAQTKQQREDYQVAEFQAKSHRFGLWGDKNPVPPWNWLRALSKPARGGLLR